MKPGDIVKVKDPKYPNEDGLFVILENHDGTCRIKNIYTKMTILKVDYVLQKTTDPVEIVRWRKKNG